MITTILVACLASLTTLHQAVQAGDCPKLFQRYCKHHSYCLTANPSCNILEYYPRKHDIPIIVDLHNNYRDKVASGMTGLPPASNMMRLQWDPELAAVAQNYTNQCMYKHDESNCRRVMNFGVGQNIAIQKLTGGHTVPTPDWHFAVNEWFQEIQYFSPDMVCPFLPPMQHEYRHFSQLAWGITFRIGCGYVLYKEGDIFEDVTYTRLYVCNYGPAGNVYDTCVYTPGNPCSDCPENTCCSSNCDFQTTNTSLCYRTNDKPPVYPPPQPNLFYCAFQGNSDCDNYINGNPNWKIEPTLGGNYLGIVLSGGENSTIVFKKKIKPDSDKYCITFKYRKGPNQDGDQPSNTADLVLYVPELNYKHSQPLQGYPNPQRQQFSTFNITLSWDKDTEIQVSFAVPPGMPDQFLNVKSILAVDGPCKN